MTSWQTAEGWLALSERGLLRPDPPESLLDSGLFVMELSLPLPDACVLLDHHAHNGWPRTFSLFHNAETGLVLLHRQGASVSRHLLPGPLPQGRGTARLSFQFNAPARRWRLLYELLDGEGGRVESHGQNPLPLQITDIQALCSNGQTNAPVLWFGLTRDAIPPGAAAWIGLRTPVETSLGPVAAGSLKPGDIILTADRGPVPLQSVQRLVLPARGTFAPVLLRAPFFGQTKDLLVSADQLVAISGAETEYLFGTEAVLMPAGALVDGRTALSDQRRAVTGSVALNLGAPALIEANGCMLATSHDAATSLPLRSLQHYEVLTLMTLLGRNPRRAA